MKVNKKAFGRTQNGLEGILFEISKTKSMQVKATNLGANHTSIKVPDRKGSSDEIAAGFSQLKLSAHKVPDKMELDHCFVFNQKNENNLAHIILTHEVSGRRMKIFSTQPGVQVYTANYLNGSLTGYNGIQYQKHHAICLETLHFPDTPNQSTFPSTLISPKNNYKQQSRWVFDLCLPN